MDRRGPGSGKNKKRMALLLAGLMLFACAGAGLPETAPPETVGLADVNELPAWLFEEPTERGEILELEYESAAEGAGVAAGVYVPYGYDPAERYDLLVLWPGSGGGAEEALLMENTCRVAYKTMSSITAVQVLDRLIETGTIRPAIVVCVKDVNYRLYSEASKDFQTVWDLVTERYSVYAADETLSPAERREHAAFLGFSQGAIYTQTLAMAEHFDDVAHFAAVCFGSRSTTGARAMNESEYPLGTLYFLTGNEDDPGAEPGRLAFRSILWRCPDKAREGENAFLRQAWFYDHSYALIPVALTDLLPRIWPGEAAAGGGKP